MSETSAKAVVLGGRTGMLGQSLMDVLRAEGVEATPQGRQDVDVTSLDPLRTWLEREKPDYVFNAIAYTAVDQAEDEPDEANALNKTLPGRLARLSGDLGFKLIHFSTDFVFDGKRDRPYQVDDEPNPLSVYGRGKLAGERAVLAVPGTVVVRTAWLFGPGRKNFVKTMLDLAQQRDELRVVHDQRGSPTYTRDLARYAYALALTPETGLFHIVNCGVATWCELATEAIQQAGFHCKVQAIGTADWPTKATRPAFSVLCNDRFKEATGITPRPWLQALREYVFQDYGLSSE